MSSSEYLITSNNVYLKLNEYTDTFEAEALMIEECKCQLVNFNTIEDFSTSCGDAYIEKDGSNYYVDYYGHTYYLETIDNMIVDYSIV